MRYVAATVLAIVALLMLIAGIWAFRYYTAETRGIIGAHEQIQSAPSRIANYEHFYDLCAAVQGHEATIRATKAQLARLEPGTDEYKRVLANLTGITAQRERAIARYNADARKSYTRGQFRDSRLPFELDPKGDTQC